MGTSRLPKIHRQIWTTTHVDRRQRPFLLGGEGEAGAVLVPLGSSPGSQGSGSCCHLVAIPCPAALPHHQRLPPVLPLRVSAQNPTEGWSQGLDFPGHPLSL